MRWRVQATWTVDGEPKSYAPQFARTRLGAKRLKRQMETTLAHFQTLEVLIERVPAESLDDLPPVVLPAVVHLIASPSATTTACGRSASDAGAVAVADVFTLSAKQCSSCAARQSD